MNRQPYDAPLDPPRQDYDERAAELDELNFEDDEPTPSFDDADTAPGPSGIIDDSIAPQNLGLTGATRPGAGPTEDDMSPETLIKEDGARSPHERGSGEPTDKTLRKAGSNEIGGGFGLDEAELGRVNPLDGKRWDGDASQPLRAQARGDETLATEDPADVVESDEDDDTR